MMGATLIPVFLLMILSCVQAPLVSQPQERPQSGDIIKISTDLVLVDALVTNQQTGRVIGNLQMDDFELYEDKVKQTITHFSQDRLPLALVLTFDIGALIPEEMLLRKELLAALRGLKAEDEVAVMAFDFGRVRLIEDFSRDRELITDRLANIREEFHRKASIPPPNGVRVGMRPGSALNQAVYEAAILLNQRYRPGLRTAIIVVTPEDKPVQFPFIGKSQKKVLEALLEPGTTVNGLVLPRHLPLPPPPNPVTAPWGLISRGSVSKYAEETGGDLVKVEGSDAGKKLSQAIERLRARYSLGYLPSNEKWDGKYRRINLTVTAEVERREGKVIIQARKGYFAKKPIQAKK